MPATLVDPALKFWAQKNPTVKHHRIFDDKLQALILARQTYICVCMTFQVDAQRSAADARKTRRLSEIVHVCEANVVEIEKGV